ncbi:MAG: hypothetical protein FJ395_11530 [Verrucomicrobia bacterium]|nr:hypothetical protein [Verrucomicrobiota bacterium]
MSKSVHISEEEVQQLQRTVEMFEAITQAQPDDYQSLEILKEAYTNLGQKTDSLRISSKLADAYEKNGQVFKAILECEGILQESPGEDDVHKRLARLEIQAKQAVGETVPVPPSPPMVEAKPAAKPTMEPPVVLTPIQQANEGDRALANILVTEKLATAQALQPLLQQLQAMRNVPHPERGLPLSLAQMVVNEQFAKLEDVLTVMLNKSMLPYLPLANYDVDREIACLLPLDLGWQFCAVPFDQISRSVLVATANPFQAAAKRTMETKLKANVFWYVSTPAEITTVLKRAHRLEAGTKPVAPQ